MWLHGSVIRRKSKLSSIHSFNLLIWSIIISYAGTAGHSYDLLNLFIQVLSFIFYDHIPYIVHRIFFSLLKVWALACPIGTAKMYKN